MRTTMTLDPDVAVRLDQMVRRRRQPMKTVVNDALRAGLAALEGVSAARSPFATTGFDLGPSLIGSLDNVEDALGRAGR